MATMFLTITCRKPTEYILECIQSVYDQTHQDWTARVVVDDAGEADLGIIKQLEELIDKDDRVTLQLNPKRLYALKNQIDSIDRYCPHHAIVGKLDGDDKLVGADALAAVSAEYDANPRLDVLWTKFDSNSKIPCCCRDFKEGEDPLTAGWRTSHFQTFRKRHIWGVRREMFTDPKTGKEWHCSCDMALLLPLLVHARERKFLDKVCYYYRRNEGDNISHEQQEVAQRIRQHNIDDNANFKKQNMLIFINGPASGRDKRFYAGERRPPMGVLSMATHLRERGHGVLLIDRFMHPSWYPSQDTIDWADTVGVYVSTPNAPDARDIIVRLRKGGFKGLVSAGGPHSILWPDQVKSWGVDMVYPGEADFAISRIVEEGIIPDYPDRIKHIDQVPFPAYDLLVEQGIFNKYSSGWPFTSSQKNVFTLNTSRGCPFSCKFCDVKTVWGKKYIAMTPERTVNDVKEAVRSFGAEAIYFREDLFCCDQKRVRGVCKIMPKGILWACEMRADLGSNEDLVKTMGEAGCRGFYVGAESGSNRLLKMMHKGITAEQIVSTCQNARKHGIFVALSMINGYPGENQEDRALTKKLLKSVKVRHVWNAKYRKPWGEYEDTPMLIIGE